MENRPPIPPEIKRAVRERCGYGCVLCGAQPYDYDHMVEYEIVKCHEAENLTLLCKHHHGEKTLKNLPRERIEQANQAPYNLSSGKTKYRLLYYAGNSVEVHIGGNTFKYSGMEDGFRFIPLQIDGQEIIAFSYEAGNLLLSFVSFDRLNQKVVEIIDNEITHSTFVWDAEWSANKLTLREGNGRFLLRLLFQTPNIIKIDKGFFHLNSTDLLLDKEALFVANNKTLLGGNMAENCTIGLNISGFGPYPETWKEIKSEFRKAKKISKKNKGAVS